MIEKQFRDQESHSLLSSCKWKKKDSENITQNIREKASKTVLESRLQLPKIMD